MDEDQLNGPAGREKFIPKLSIAELGQKTTPMAEIYGQISNAKDRAVKVAQQVAIDKFGTHDPENVKLTEAQRVELQTILSETASAQYAQEKQDMKLPPDAETQALTMLTEKRKYCEAHPEQQQEITTRLTEIQKEIDAVLIGLKKKNGELFYLQNAHSGAPLKPGTSRFEGWSDNIRLGKQPTEFLSDPTVKVQLDDESRAKLEALGNLRMEITDLQLANYYFTMENANTEPRLNQLAKGKVI